MWKENYKLKMKCHFDMLFSCHSDINTFLFKLALVPTVITEFEIILT